MPPQFKLKMPERFDGKRRDEYAQGWLYSTDKYVTGMQLNDEQINSLLSTLFIDNALTWFRMLEMSRDRVNALCVSRGEAPPWTWAEFKPQFEAHYVSPLLKEKARRALKDIKMHKSVAGYNAQFNSTLVQCGLDFPEDIALDYYLDGLHPALMAWVRQVQPTSLEQAQTEADRQERTLKLTIELSGRMPAPKPHRRVDLLPPGEPMQLGSAQVPGNRPAAGRGRGSGRGFGHGRGADRGPGRGRGSVPAKNNDGCFICGDPKHWRRDCPNKKTQQLHNIEERLNVLEMAIKTDGSAALQPN